MSLVVATIQSGVKNMRLCHGCISFPPSQLHKPSEPNAMLHNGQGKPTIFFFFFRRWWNSSSQVRRIMRWDNSCHAVIQSQRSEQRSNAGSGQSVNELIGWDEHNASQPRCQHDTMQRTEAARRGHTHTHKHTLYDACFLLRHPSLSLSLTHTHTHKPHPPPLHALSPTSLSNSLLSIILGGPGRAGWCGSRGWWTRQQLAGHDCPLSPRTVFSVSL